MNTETPISPIPEEEIRWNLLPEQLSHCIIADCPLAGKCLRHLGYYYSQPDDFVHSYLHPKRSSIGIGEKCTYYLPNTLSHLPLGFIKGLAHVSSGDADRIRKEIMSELKLSKTVYYNWRKGSQIIPEEARDILIRIFEKYNVKADQIFDNTVDRYPSYYSKAIDAKE